jgi:hypothetical protein
MPKLHQYKDRDSYYVLTAINNSIITFQLTPQGERKLREAGVLAEQKFSRGLLLDLCRSGDAYTGGSGVGEPLAHSTNQLELDFPQDPDPETLFPRCDDGAGMDDLHLSVLREQGALAAKLQCAHHRNVTSHLLDTCIPLRLVTLSLIGRLFEIKPVTKKYEGVERLENLLRSEFESKWEELRKLRRASQASLFGTGLESESELNRDKKS